MCRVRAAHLGPLPPERFGPGLACQVCAVLRVQGQPDGEMFLSGWPAVLPDGLLQVRLILTSFHLTAVNVRYDVSGKSFVLLLHIIYLRVSVELKCAQSIGCV